MKHDKLIMFENRLVKVFKHLSKQARRSTITCYRVYDHDLPEFPLCIEIYENNLYVAEYLRKHRMTETEHEIWMEECINCISKTLSFQKENIYLKLRKRKPGRLGQYQKQSASHNEFVVYENGLQFLVNLSDYLDTGLFLDHRITRQLVREQSKGKKLLNLFAYTGAFSVYAAAGGAKEVTSVDLSKTYLNWAERNLRLNGFEDDRKYSMVQADVKQWLQTIPSSYFDIIILDPPTFSNSKRMEDILDIQRDHGEMINQCMNGLSDKGQLYFSTNFRKFKLDVENIKAGSIKDITKLTTPFDFKDRLKRKCFLIAR